MIEHFKSLNTSAEMTSKNLLFITMGTLKKKSSLNNTRQTTCTYSQRTKWNRQKKQLNNLKQRSGDCERKDQIPSGHDTVFKEDKRWVWRNPWRSANDSNQSFTADLHTTAFLSHENKHFHRWDWSDLTEVESSETRQCQTIPNHNKTTFQQMQWLFPNGRQLNYVA